MGEVRPTRLVLVRHGESRAAVERVMGGHAGCTGLSERGRRQAEALRHRLARTGELADATALLASVLPRAIETAELLAPALPALDLDRHCDLCELHPGEADGLDAEEYERRYPGMGGGWPYAPPSPGGESWAEFMVRVGRTLRDLAGRHAGGTVVAVCHGGIIEGSLLALGELPLRRPFDLQIDNTSITEWLGPPHGPDGRWRLVRFNDAAHLAAVDGRLPVPESG